MSWLLSPAAATIDFGDLGNVDLTGAATGDMLYYDGADWVDTAGHITFDPTGGTDNSGTFPTLNLGNGTFAAGEANLHIDHITGAGEANEYLFILASNGSPRFKVERDGDMTFYSKIQIPGNTALQWSGANTRITGQASAEIKVYTHSGTERAEFSSYGLGVRGGNAFRVYDSGNTDYIDMSHDGTDFNIDFTNTTSVNTGGVRWNFTAAETGSGTSLRGAIHIDGGANNVNKITGRNGGYIEMYNNAGGISIQPFGDLFICPDTAKNIDLGGSTISDLGGNLSTAAGFKLGNWIGSYIAPYDAGTGDFYIVGSTAANTAIGDIVLKIGVSSNKILEANKASHDIRIFDIGGTDYVTQSHDGTNYNIVGTNTTDVNFTGASGKYYFDEPVHSLDAVIASGTVSDVNQVAQFAFMDVSGGFGRFGSFDYDAAAWQPFKLQGSNIQVAIGTTVIMDITSTSVQLLTGQDLWLRDAGILRIYDSTDTDYVAMSHDGTDFNIAATNTTDVNFTGASFYKFDGDLMLLSNEKVICYDSDSSDSIQMYNIGDEAIIATQGTGNFPLRLVASSSYLKVSADSIFLAETAAASADITAHGQLWVKDTTPCELWFTDDAGTSTQIV